MWVALLFAGLFAVVAVSNVVRRGALSWNAAAEAAIAFALWQLFVLARREGRLIEEFDRWLAEHAGTLHDGPAAYEDAQLDLDSSITQFQAQASFLVVTFTVRSRPYVVGHDPLLLPGALYTIYSLVLGWWSFPWGPIKTVAALVVNCSGGKRSRLRDLVAEATRHARSVFRLTPSAADEVRRVLSERGFAPGTAMRVVAVDPTVDDFEIEYDLPINDGRDWQMQSEGLLVLVDKRAVEKWDLHDVLVDFEKGRFTFQRT